MDIQDPGPDAEQIDQLLTAALRVPDHGKLGPWRFILFQGESRSEFGKILSARFKALNPTAPDRLLELESNRFNRAPLVICVVSKIRPGIKIPEWEQQLSAGAASQNILVAANLLGFAAQWLTEWYAYDAEIDQALGLEEHERVAAFVYVGSASEKPPERDRPTVDQRVSLWSG
jgi:nitroreductase